MCITPKISNNGKNSRKKIDKCQKIEYTLSEEETRELKTHWKLRCEWIPKIKTQQTWTDSIFFGRCCYIKGNTTVKRSITWNAE